MSASSQTSESTCESPAEKLRDVVAGWIDMVASQGERAIDAFGMRPPGKPWVPHADVVETEVQVVVYVDLPGVDPQTVEILLVGNMLTVKGDQPSSPVRTGETVHRRERPTGTFSRSIALPVPVDPEKVSAESKNGVLMVTLAKEERVKPRHIPIGVKTSLKPGWRLHSLKFQAHGLQSVGVGVLRGCRQAATGLPPARASLCLRGIVIGPHPGVFFGS